MINSTFNLGQIATAQLNVAVAGTAEQAASIRVVQGVNVIIKAKDANTGSIWLGATQADAQNHAVAFELAAGQAVSLGITDVSVIWFDASVGGEGVSFLMEA